MQRFRVLKAIFNSLNVFRLIIINIVFFVFLFAFFGLAGGISVKDKKSGKIPANSILRMCPEGFISEVKGEFEWIEVIAGEHEKTVLLLDLVNAIKKAASDYKIKALYLDFSRLHGLSSAHFSELANALRLFKESGKQIYAHSSFYSIPDYYLASFADKVAMDPMGEADFSGFASEALFFKGMEEKFGIRWNVIQAGAFKGAAERYSRSSMSEYVRSNISEMLNGLWSSYLADIASNRGLSKEKLRNFAENHYEVIKKYAGDAAEACLSEGIVTHLIESYDFEKSIEDEFSKSLNTEIAWVDYRNYGSTEKYNSGSNKIALINLTGAITSANSKVSARTAYAPLITELFEKALDDKNVKAIVLRIDSGGGEVNASEEIRRAVIKASRKNHIPVVVSMGSVAASGAYWISSAADYIFATPYTITGSIGVLAVMPSFEDTLKDKFGITADSVYAGQPPLYSAVRNKTPDDIAYMELSIAHIYKLFIQKVAEGRKMPFETVEDLAGGKVYSGSKALQLNLVDELGTLKDAADYAANLAGISGAYYMEEISKELSPMKKLLNSISYGKASYMDFLDFKAAVEFLSLNSKNGIYLYTPERLMWVK